MTKVVTICDFCDKEFERGLPEVDKDFRTVMTMSSFSHNFDGAVPTLTYDVCPICIDKIFSKCKRKDGSSTTSC